MMGGRAILCLDEAMCCNPGSIGLEDEAIESQGWLEVCASGDEARKAVAANGEVAEAWVVSCGDVEPINLAASIKADKPDTRVSLVSSELCGSLLSRAHTAEIDEVIDFDAFRRRYTQAKRDHHVSPESGENAAAGAEGADWVACGAEVPVEAAGRSLADAGLAESAVLAPVEETVEPRLIQPTLQLPVTLPHPAPAVAVPDNRAFVMTVVSGSGGAGKSSVSALGAVIARNMGYRTLLLDCDLQFGDVATLLGVENPLRIDELLIHPERLDSELVQGKDLSVLAAPLRLEFSEEVVRSLPSLLERLTAVFEVIMVNTGASWAEQHAVLLERSSASLFLIDQRASSVHACRHALELCARCGIATNPFHFALNRCAKGSPLTSIDVSCALQGVPVFELKDGGREVEDYLSGGAASELLEMKNEFAKSLEQVVARLLPDGSQRLGDHGDEKPARRRTLRRGSKPSRKRGRSRQ